jgi:hypothetical protein
MRAIRLCIAAEQYVWDPRNIDAAVLRQRADLLASLKAQRQGGAA